jgi:hypothetical protein
LDTTGAVSRGYWLGGDGSGKAVWFFGDSVGAYTGYWLYSTTSIADSVWHQVSGTLSGDTARLYVDGIMESMLWVPNVELGSTIPLMIGNDIFNDIYAGKIDDIRIWDTLRTDIQINQYKNSCLSGTENHLSVFYHFENFIGTSQALDLTGHGVNGSIVNGDTTNMWSTGINCELCDFSINKVSDLTTNTSGITISANNSGATYQWLDCNNNYGIIAGETSQSFSATTNGNYAIELTENGCIDTTACVAIISVGILENSFGDDLIIYPNPTNGNFSIDLGSIYEASHISITDISGKLIDSKYITQSQILNLSIEEPIGIYIISIHASDKNAVIRLIKE